MGTSSTRTATGEYFRASQEQQAQDVPWAHHTVGSSGMARSNKDHSAQEDPTSENKVAKGKKVAKKVAILLSEQAFA